MHSKATTAHLTLEYIIQGYFDAFLSAAHFLERLSFFVGGLGDFRVGWGILGMHFGTSIS